MDRLAELLKGRPPELVFLCERLLTAVELFDDVRIEVSPKVVVLHSANRIFGSIRPTQRGLNVHLNLPHHVEDRRVTRSEPLTKKLTFYRFLLSSPNDLDEQFTNWISEAHDASRTGR